MSQNEEVKQESEETKSEGSNPISDFWKDVEAALTDVAQVARGRLKDLYVEEEIQDRTSLLKKGFTKVRESKNELKKMKPDMKSRDLQGKIVEQWSSEAWDKKQKAVETCTKLEKALTTALEGKGFEDLKKLAG